jgi:hypothetical protein
MGSSLPMLMRVIVAYIYNHLELIYRALKKVLSGLGLMNLILWLDLLVRNGLLLIGQQACYYGALELAKDMFGESMAGKLLLLVRKPKLKYYNLEIN